MKKGDVLYYGILILIAITVMFVFSPAKIHGQSMESNFSEGEYVIVSKLFYGEIERGDVVIADEYRKLIKRVIALPGEHIEIKEGKVYINGELLDEPYLDENTYTDGNIDLVIPENKYFVMGDNRAHSTDSRFEGVGAVDKEHLIGVVVVRIYPLTQFKYY